MLVAKDRYSLGELQFGLMSRPGNRGSVALAVIPPASLGDPAP